jgi:hypothetical protein
MEHILFEGEAHRNFSDSTEDKSHAGRDVSTYLSATYNLSTSFSPGDGAEDRVKDLKRIQSEIDRSQHQANKTSAVRETREWYKDKMKVEVSVVTPGQDSSSNATDTRVAVFSSRSHVAVVWVRHYHTELSPRGLRRCFKNVPRVCGTHTGVRANSKGRGAAGSR